MPAVASSPKSDVYALPYIQTPLVPSLYLSEIAGCKVLLKLEDCQPSGSFKSRGLGNLVHHTVSNAPAGKRFHFFSPSGGNAGCATAYAARLYGQSCTVCVPTTTNPAMIARIRKTGATVIPHGNYIADCVKHIQEVLIPACEEEAVYCHPYDNPVVWQGNSTLADELVDQFGDAKPDAVVCSVGGGGLYNGIVQGFKRAGWNDVDVVAVETEGSSSLAQSIKAGGKQIFLTNPNTIATSLSTPSITKETIEYAMKTHPTHSVVVPDSEAAEACVRFANDHKLLIEAACGTALAPLYKGRLREILPKLDENSTVVVVVCGGTSVSWDILKGYADKWNIPLN
ncbi:L-threo-3-hydroxyaspartate ammonia-lyase [Trichomonascus vanleenenianus]|uniref:L-threo-3-hydroxyaspartate ammonia-lyase n=1 Tax=Trichomonascus vanleenenianus TaxID=2268995 RepID=UPI003ECB4316